MGMQCGSMSMEGSVEFSPKIGIEVPYELHYNFLVSIPQTQKIIQKNVSIQCLL